MKLDYKNKYTLRVKINRIKARAMKKAGVTPGSIQ